MKTYSKVILSGVVLAALGASGAALARNHGHMGMGGGMGGQQMYERMCSADAPKLDGNKMADRIVTNLKLTDAQKTAFEDMHKSMQDTRAAAKTTLCADPKPDFATATGRAAFGIKATESRLANMKAMQPKLEAFYATLTDDQKKSFNDMGPGRHGDKGWGKGGHGHHGQMMDGPDGQ